MWLTLLVLLTFISKGSYSEITAFYEDNETGVNVTWADYIFSQDEIKKHSDIEETLQHYRQCRGREWSCDKRCRLEFRSETKLCRNPFPGDECFGIPITYKYTHDFELIRFPHELTVLTRYPRCWSYLAPIICATIYRPCSRNFYIEKDEQNNVKNGTIELWQVMSLSRCETAREMCVDLVSADLFPSLIKCEEKDSQSKTSRALYSSACPQEADQFTLPIRTGACSWPLVSVPRPMDAHIVPVLDSCFLPCRSPLVPTFLASRFRTVWFVICLILAVLFVMESIYLSRFSKSFSQSCLLFFVSHAMISIAVYFIVWSLSIFEYFFTLSNCSIDGISRKYAILHSSFEWCSLQSLILYFSFLSAFFWLFILYFYIIFPPSIIGHFLPLRSYNVQFRPLLILLVYGVSAIFSTLVMNNLRENDGVSGLCHNGLVTWWKYFISLSPLFCLFFILVVVGMMAIFKQDGKWFLKTIATKHALCVLNNLEKDEYRRRLLKTKGCSNEIKARESIEYSKQSNDCKAAPETIDLISQNKPIELVQIDQNWTSTYDGLLSKDHLQQVFDEETKKSYRTLTRVITSDRNFGLSTIWTVASFVFLSVYLFLSPAIHYLHFNLLPEQEIKSIIEYTNCGTANVLINRSFNWQSGSAWSQTAATEVSSCSLPSIKAQERLESVFVVFIVLPALPFIILLFALLTGVGKMDGTRASTEFSKSTGKTEEYFHLVSVGEVDDVPAESIEIANPNRDTVQRKNIEQEMNVIPKHGTQSEPSAQAPNEEEYHTFPIDKEKLDDPESSEDSKEFNENSQENECQEFLFNIVNQVKGELTFQQSMLVNDSAAWNICLVYLQRFEQCFSTVGGQTDSASIVNQDLRVLSEEISRILPVLSDHAVQLWRWMNSVQQASMKLDYLQGISDDKDYSCSLFESQDISRQHNLLALNNYLLQFNQQRKRTSEMSFFPADSQKQMFTQQTCAQNEKVQSKTVTEAQQTRNEQSMSVPSGSRNIDKETDDGQKGQCSIGQDGNIASNQQVPDIVGQESSVVNNDINQGVSTRRSHQIQRCQVIPRISAYAGSYSATPRGILTKLSLPELRLRVQQIKHICAGDNLFPQELSYMLLVTGDIIYGGGQPKEGQFFYTVEQTPGIFGTRVPTIDARVGVQDFLAQMRRRALTVVGAIGYHYSFHTAGGTSYTPPVLPPLGLYRSENELVLRRVLGDRDDVLPILRDFLKEFHFGRGPISARPDLKLAFSFRNYLAMVATREGFNNDHYEEYISDPVPPLETVSDLRDNETDGGEIDDDIDPAPPS